MMKTARGLFLALVFFLTPLGPASACIVYGNINMLDLRHADVVFVGELLSYEMMREGSERSQKDYGLLTFRVIRTLKGEDMPLRRLYRWSSNSGLPAKMQAGKQLIVAGATTRFENPPFRGSKLEIFARENPEILRVMQAPCAPPLLFDYNEQSSADVTAALTAIEHGDQEALKNYRSQ